MGKCLWENPENLETGEKACIIKKKQGEVGK